VTTVICSLTVAELAHGVYRAGPSDRSRMAGSFSIVGEVELTGTSPPTAWIARSLRKAQSWRKTCNHF
jgi:hypothetical protein